MTDTLTLDGCDALEEMTALAQWIDTVAMRQDLTRSERFRLEMVLTESVTNVIDHAFSAESPGQITVSVSCSDAEIEATVIDKGQPFNPLTHSIPERSRSLEEAAIGGAGISLIRHFVDECSYQRNDHDNQLTMRILR